MNALNISYVVVFLAMLALLLYLCGYLVWGLSTWARRGIRILRGQELIVLHKRPPPTPRQRRWGWVIALAFALWDAAQLWQLCHGTHRPWTHHGGAILLGGTLLMGVPFALGMRYAMRKYGYRVEEEGREDGSAASWPPPPRSPGPSSR